jgi:hypothetical protein
MARSPHEMRSSQCGKAEIYEDAHQDEHCRPYGDHKDYSVRTEIAQSSVLAALTNIQRLFILILESKFVGNFPILLLLELRQQMNLLS